MCWAKTESMKSQSLKLPNIWERLEVSRGQADDTDRSEWNRPLRSTGKIGRMNEKQLGKGNKLSLLIHSAQDSLHGPLLHAHSGTCLSHWEEVNHGDCASDTLVQWHSTASQTVSYSMIWPEEPARRPSLLQLFFINVTSVLLLDS